MNVKEWNNFAEEGIAKAEDAEFRQCELMLWEFCIDYFLDGEGRYAENHISIFIEKIETIHNMINEMQLNKERRKNTLNE